MLFSASCVDVDLDTGELAFSSAAHPPLCIVSGNDATFVEGGGAFLGLRSRVRFETRRMPVGRGDGIYLVTDGFAETAESGGQQFGDERLLATIRDAHLGNVLAGKALDEAVLRFAGEAGLSDDATFIGVRRPI
jgi:sigma-B regulation protein RsbU (phosphoserine phosphatase)